jgi:hypothetical protein
MVNMAVFKMELDKKLLVDDLNAGVRTIKPVLEKDNPA